MIDAAAEYEGYAADITRTIPVSGTFTAEQRADLSARARRAGRGGAQLEAGQVSRRRRRIRRSRCARKGWRRSGSIESEDATFDPPWQANCERAAGVVQAGECSG